MMFPSDEGPIDISDEFDISQYIELEGLEAISGTGHVVRSGVGTYVTRTIIAPAAGITISNGSGVAGNPTLALADDLAGLEGMSSTGLVARTGSGTYANRTITAGANISVNDGNGVSGDPTIALTGIGSTIQAWDADLDAIAALASTGIAVRTASNTWAQRTITGTANEITLTNGDGVSGNPVVSLPSAITLTGKAITGGTFSSPTLTTPNIGVATGTSLTLSSLTAGRVALVGTSGLLTDSSSITYSAGVITATGFTGAHNGTLGATTPSTIAATTGAFSSTLSSAGQTSLATSNGGVTVSTISVANSVLAINASGSGRSALTANTNGIEAITLLSNATGSTASGIPNGFSGLSTVNQAIVFAPQGTERARISSTGFQGPLGQTTPAAVSATTGAFSGTLTAGAPETGVATPKLAAYNTGNVFIVARDTTNNQEWLAGATASATYSGSATNIPYILRVNNADIITINTSGMNGPLGQTTPAAIAGTTGAFSDTVSITKGATSGVQLNMLRNSAVSAIGVDNGGSIGTTAAAGDLVIRNANAKFIFANNSGTTITTVDSAGYNGPLGATTPAAATVTDLREPNDGYITYDSGNATGKSLTIRDGGGSTRLSISTGLVTIPDNLYIGAATGAYDKVLGQPTNNPDGHGATNVPTTVTLFAAGGAYVKYNAVTGGAFNNSFLTFGVHQGGVFQGEAMRLNYTKNLLINTTTDDATNKLQVNGGVAVAGDLTVSGLDITTGAASALNLNTSGGLQAQIGHVASAVNYVALSGSATGNRALVGARGGDTDVGLTIYSQGAGEIDFITNTNVNRQVRIAHTASANRYITLTGSNGGNPTIGVSAGSLAITPATVFASTVNATSFTASGTSTLPSVNFTNLQGGDILRGIETITEQGSTPSTPTAGSECRVYMKTDKFIVQYNHAGTVRYYSIDLTLGAGQSWAHSTTAP